jgi:hypothetical protein
MWLSLVVNLAQAGSNSETAFAFEGQPPCVELVYSAGTVSITNGCAEPILLDESVLLPAAVKGRARLARLEPSHTTEIAGLTYFSVGMGGSLYRVTAILASAPPPLQLARAP